MIQLYFLYIVFSVAGGVILCADMLKERTPGFSKFIDLINTKEVKFVIGIISFLVGFFKLIFPMGWVIVGDLFPAVMAIVMGAALWLDFYKEVATINSELLNRADELLLQNRNLIGGISLVLALLHFIFARVPIFL